MYWLPASYIPLASQWGGSRPDEALHARPYDEDVGVGRMLTFNDKHVVGHIVGWVLGTGFSEYRALDEDFSMLALQPCLKKDLRDLCESFVLT